MKQLYDENLIRQAIDAMKDPGQLFEIRILDNNSKKAIVGFFTDTDTLLGQLKKVDTRGKNVYITVNGIDYDLYSLTPHDKFVLGAQSTSDGDITAYEWLFIDLDPARKSGISSSDEELSLSSDVADKVQEFMASNGFSEPIRAMSGNGTHLLYRIDLLITDENKNVVRRCLEVLADMFNTDKVKIDTVNYNPARICKLYGTLAQKGADTDKRPHRMSYLISGETARRSVNGVHLLKRITGEMPEPKPAARMLPDKREFDLLPWMAEHGITYFSTGSGSGNSVIYNLDECPFDPSHKHGDAKIFQYADGAIAFKCHHNSCRNYKWQDLREKMEPGCYDQEQEDDHIDRGWQQHKLAIKALAEKEQPKKKKEFRQLKTASGILAKDLPDPVVFIGNSGDDAMLVEGTCILSAKPKLGKSWLVLAMCLACAKGEDFLGFKTKRCSTLYLDLETSERTQQKRIRKMLGDDEPPANFYLDTETDRLEHGFVEQIEDYLVQDPNIGIVVVDVFQIIRSEQKSVKENEYEHAYRDLTPLNALAEKYHISIILVCHDRKMVDENDPFSNILGSTGIQGAATQMVVMFKPKKDSPIHISIKGKNIDSLPELDVVLDNAKWERVDSSKAADAEKQKNIDDYFASNIREAIVRLCDDTGGFAGRCGELAGEAAAVGVAITETPKEIGSFFNKMAGYFMKFDNIVVNIINNGTGPKIYRISKYTKTTIDTIDDH